MPLDTRLLPTHIQREEYAISRHWHEALPGVSAEDVLDPDYWVHVATRLRVNDIVTVVSATGDFEVEMRVVAKDPRNLWAQMRPLRHCGATGVSIAGVEAIHHMKAVSQWPDEDGYSVEYSKPHKWRIVDRIGSLVAKDYPDEQTAIAALANIKQAKAPKAAA